MDHGHATEKPQNDFVKIDGFVKSQLVCSIEGKMIADRDIGPMFDFLFRSAKANSRAFMAD